MGEAVRLAGMYIAQKYRFRCASCTPRRPHRLADRLFYLRESFNEAKINQALTAQDSPWRVRKFGMTRGAAGVSAVLLRQLPVQEGDLVVHSVAMGNFSKKLAGLQRRASASFNEFDVDDRFHATQRMGNG